MPGVWNHFTTALCGSEARAGGKDGGTGGIYISWYIYPGDIYPIYILYISYICRGIYISWHPGINPTRRRLAEARAGEKRGQGGKSNRTGQGVNFSGL